MKKKIKVVKDRYDLLPKIDEAKKEDLSKAEIIKTGFTEDTATSLPKTETMVLLLPFSLAGVDVP